MSTPLILNHFKKAFNNSSILANWLDKVKFPTLFFFPLSLCSMTSTSLFISFPFWNNQFYFRTKLLSFLLTKMHLHISYLVLVKNTTHFPCTLIILVVYIYSWLLLFFNKYVPQCYMNWVGYSIEPPSSVSAYGFFFSLSPELTSFPNEKQSILCVYFVCFLAVPVACESSWARDWTWATAVTMMVPLFPTPQGNSHSLCILGKGG